MSEFKDNKTSNRDLNIMLKYMLGMHVDKIAKQEKVSKTTIYKVIKKHNIPLKQEKEVRKYFRNKIFNALKNEGKTFKEISEETGIPEIAINGYVNFEYKRISKKNKSKDSKKKLNPTGLLSKVGKTNKEVGIRISRTKEEKEKLDDFKNNGRNVKLAGFNLSELSSEDENEKLKLAMLRELLRYASKVNGLPDYSNDPLLISDYLLPVDIIVAKDISARLVSGQDIDYIATVHRTEPNIVNDLIDKNLPREEFRDRFIDSLVRRGFFTL